MIGDGTCSWCGKSAVLDESQACELDACDAVLCGSWCADFHMGKHEDYGDCVRDRNGEVISPRRRASRRLPAQLVR